MPTTGPRTVVSASVPHSWRVALERLAREGDRSLSREVKRALSRHLERETAREEAGE
jgi:predicted transcriptional regulator